MTSHARDDALDQIAVAAAEVARRLSEATDKHPSDVKDEDITRLKTAAEGIKAAGEAAEAVSYGPQGGNMDYRMRNETDYHYTTHDGEPRSRRPGFSNGEA